MAKVDMFELTMGAVLFAALIPVIIELTTAAAANASGATKTLILLIGLFVTIIFIRGLNTKFGKGGR